MKESTIILLLEDNDYDAELIQYQVLNSDIKCEFLHVSDWDGFVEAIESSKPDIILSDYNLGNFTAKDVLEFAKNNCPSIPIIIVTGALDEETVADLIKMGACNYIEKEKIMHLSLAIEKALL